MRSNSRRIDFPRIASAALDRAAEIVPRWVPVGRREGREWVGLNPRRGDKHLGSFKVNLSNGRWLDAADGASGGDLISLSAYLHNEDQRTAAIGIATMLGVDPFV